jgi:hypothetical protein
MSRSEPGPSPRSIDWPGWICLAWADGAGILYVRMILECRAPGVLAALGRWLGR